MSLDGDRAFELTLEQRPEQKAKKPREQREPREHKARESREPSNSEPAKL
jgi:hypothetical protein